MPEELLDFVLDWFVVDSFAVVSVHVDGIKTSAYQLDS
jgi:hypothetical protein